MAEIDELEIYNKLTSGASINGLAREYGVDKKKIRSIRENGKYYLNLTTGEIIFTSKAISFDEQLFHQLYVNLEINDLKGMLGKPEIILERAVIPRLANFLMGLYGYDYNKKKSIETKLRGWAKKKDKLVGCDENGAINLKIEEIQFEFICSEIIIISKNYYLDDRGLPKGWGLWYVTITDKWLYYLKDYINRLLKDSKLTEKELKETSYNIILEKLKKTEDIELKTALKKQLELNFINSKVAYRLVKKYGDKVYSNINSNDKYRILYLDTTAFYKKLIPDEMEKILLEYIYND